MTFARSQGIHPWRREAGRRPGLRAAALALAPALLLAACAKERNSQGEPRAVAESASDSLARLEPFEAYRRGLTLGRQQRFEESLPYFRRALEVPPRAWQPHCDYAISLFHATLQARAGLPGDRPVTRSSYERVSMMREALAQLDVAEAMTQVAAERAYVVSLRARYLNVWGLAWNALAEYHRAGSLDPKYLQLAFAEAAMMQNPVATAVTTEAAARSGAAAPRPPTGPRLSQPRPPATPPDTTAPPVPAEPDTAAPSPAEPDTSDRE